MTSTDQLDVLNSRARMLHQEAILAHRRGDTGRLVEIRAELADIGRRTDQAEAI